MVFPCPSGEEGRPDASADHMAGTDIASSAEERNTFGWHDAGGTGQDRKGNVTDRYQLLTGI